jgi:glycerol-3-phosphate dehydrogenase
VISDEEVRYLCDAINHVFKREIEPSDVVWTYSGVRPLFDDGSSSASAVTRDYVFDLNAPQGQAPVLSIFGGKITTFRKLAEQALDELKPFFPAMKPTWTENAKLPGGDMPDGISIASSPTFCAASPSWPRSMLSAWAALWHAHRGALGAAQSWADLGEDFGAGLTAAEVDYLVRREWAHSADDILWRRSKLGLHVPVETAQRIEAYLAEKRTAAIAAQ